MRNSYLMLLLVASMAKAESLPPLGKRVYILESNSIYTPVRIEQDFSLDGEKEQLRDPIRLKRDKLSGKLIPVKKSKGPVRDGSKLAFKPLPVKGRVSSPRVKFTLETLDLQQVDAPLELDVAKRLIDQVRRHEDLARRDPPE